MPVEQQDKDKPTSKGNASGISWTLVIVLIVIGVFISISNRNSSPLSDKETRQIADDVNYCRSVAATYGQQGTQAFSQSYNSCMDGKGW